MKHIYFLLTFCSFLFSCAKNDTSQSSVKAPIPSLVVVIYDISLSTDNYAMLEPAHFKLMYQRIGVNGGGKFYGLFVKANSEKQDPLTMDIPALQTLPIKGNAYQQKNRMDKNKELEVEFNRGNDAFVKTASEKMILPKTEQFSDVQHAFQLARDIFSMPQYATWTKRLIIISDCENDFPPNDGIDSMEPVKFKADVKIGVVRQSPEVNVSALIGGANFTPYTTIPDAITSIINR